MADSIYPLSVSALSGLVVAFDGNARRLILPETVEATASWAAIALANRREVDPSFRPIVRWQLASDHPTERAKLGIPGRASLTLLVPSFMFPEPKWWHFTSREGLIAVCAVFAGLYFGVYVGYICHARRKT